MDLLKMGLTLLVLAAVALTLVLALWRPVIRAVCKRNFLSYFSGVIGYLFILTFVVLSAFLAFGPAFFGANLANLDQLNKVFPILLLFIVPAITMSAWSDERKLGTDELLFTLPARDLEIVAGKYLAVLGVYTIALVFSLSLVGVLLYLGSPDFGMLLATYFGYWIAGAALLSAGMVASILTSSATVAYVLGSLICAIPVFIDHLAFGNRLIQGLSVNQQFREFGLGVIPLGSVLFFLSFTVWMLYINLVLVSRRHWVGGPHNEMTKETKAITWGLFGILFSLYLIPIGIFLAPRIRDKMVDWGTSETMGGVLSGLSLFGIWAVSLVVLLAVARYCFGVMGTHFLHRIVACGFLLISANVVAANFNDRIDLTSERIYSLSPVTTKLLKEIKPEKPVRIQAFISPDVPREYSGVRSTLIGMLRQFQQIGGRNVILRIVDTDRFTDAETEALRYKIEPQEIATERGGRSTRDVIFQGVVVTAGTDDEIVIPFIDVGTPIEYELTSAIRTLVNAKRKKVGILRTDANLLGGSPFPGARRGREWRLVTDLKRQYDVVDVSPLNLKDVSSIKPEQREFDVLMAVMPSSLTDPEMDKLVTYVKSGGPALLIDDPLPIFHTNLMPRSPKPPKPPTPQMQMMGMQHSMPEFKSDEGKATKLMNALGVSWNHESVVWDAYDAHPDLTESLANGRLNAVYIGAKSGGSAPFSDQSNITSGLQEIMTFFPGEIRITEQKPEGSAGKEKKADKGIPSWFVPLLRTSSKTAALGWDKYTRTSPQTGELELSPPTDLELEYKPEERVLAARITGHPGGSPEPEASSKEDKTKDGKAKDGQSAAKTPALNVVLLMDLDMVDDQFFFIRDKDWQSLKLDNISFVMNALDELSGDDEFVTLRKRRAKHRTLMVVEQATESFKRDQAAEDRLADKEARTELESRKESLGEEVKRIQGDKSLDTRTRMIQLLIAQSRQQQLMNQAEKEISDRKYRRKHESRKQFERQVRRIENNVRTWALILLPLPVLLVGSFVFASRLTEERQGANPQRIRSGR